ncbi:MAG TPA: MlaD family protein [Holophagaceae bacterium]|jgi:phospholipid/cholesterol/gamma-HCH transport system substrate-binding protein|nr:MlaD family protein [Holophagaceae bacterium]
MKLETKVGAFFVGAVVVIGFLAMQMEKLQLGGNGGAREGYTVFDQVAGLNPQAPVRVAGVKVGEVKRIILDRGRAKVVITLDSNLPVHSDATATLSSIGILGEKYVDLNPGKDDDTIFNLDQPIPSKSGASLDQLMETLADIGKDVKGVTYALNKSIGGEEGRAKLDEIVDNIRQLTAEFRAMAQENHEGINQTVANVQAMTGDLRDRLPELAQRFDDLGKHLDQMVQENRPELKGTLEDVHKLAQNFEGTASNLREMTDRINRGEGTVGKLLNDDTTVKKLNQTLDSVNDALGGFKKLDMRLDLGAAQWTKRHDSATYFNIELAPREDYWYAIQLASTPDGKIHDETRTVTKIDPVTGLPVSVLENNRYVTTEQTFSFGAQFAKRWGPAVFSAGIVQGKGGGGVELRGMEDKLRLGVLAYDFSKTPEKPNARVRLTGSWQFWKGAYVQAGVQDMANKDLRTFFVGGGLRWKDEDLKKLIGLAAAGK